MSDTNLLNFKSATIMYVFNSPSLKIIILSVSFYSYSYPQEDTLSIFLPTNIKRFQNIISLSRPFLQNLMFLIMLVAIVLI